MDREMIDLWERGSLRSGEDSAKRLSLLQSTVSELERRLNTSSPDELFALGTQLRELYRQYLESARDHHASSPPYQAIKAQVVAGLEKIERLSRRTTS